MRLQDLTGQVFGRLTVIERGEDTRAGVVRWVCKCDCGTLRTVVCYSLLRGVSMSCGCFQRDQARKNIIDRIGQRFGRLLVIGRGKNRGNKVVWLCQCDCGERRLVYACSLQSGNSTSCGCFQREQLGKNATTHGAKTNGKTTREYSTWANMLNRTTNEGAVGYEYYGGRGISVCERWRGNFENFLEDMGPRPMGKSLDRIDNNLGYSASNCRWASDVEQARNKSNNLQVEYQGETRCLSEWACILGVKYTTLYMRITKLGMGIEEAFEKPVGRWAK